MNRKVKEVYNRALVIVLDDFNIIEEKMFSSNEPDCVNARVSLIVTLHEMGLTDNEIAECTKKLRRCSVCQIHNKYNNRTANWEVKTCIEHLKKNIVFEK